MVRLTVRRNKGRAGFSGRLWLGPRYLNFGWFHYKAPTFPPRAF